MNFAILYQKLLLWQKLNANMSSDNDQKFTAALAFCKCEGAVRKFLLMYFRKSLGSVQIDKIVDFLVNWNSNMKRSSYKTDCSTT